MKSSSCASFETWPSVAKITWRSGAPLVCNDCGSASCSAGSISVPPSTSSLRTHAFAVSTAPTSAGTLRGKSADACDEKRMTLKLSVGASRSMPSTSASRACSSGVPDIEPEVSMTKIVSRGSRAAAAPATSGGITMSSA